mmetsp:Transcript_27493/g.57373  ORF Transcript_27493/g.57373 Transcript_27493/m.57373 type:complete len:900 (+) Transcript_27493:94-2793(+)
MSQTAIPSISHLFGRNNDHAITNPTADANGIIVQSYAPKENSTEDIWNENTSLINDIRTILSETFTLDTCNNDDNGSEDLAMAEHLRLFADQIDSKAEETTLNASMLLEELELYSSSPNAFNFDKLNDGTVLADVSRLEESNRDGNSNSSLTGGENWLRDIQEDVSIIESWEVEAEKLSHVAIAAFQNLKNDTSNIMESATREAISELKKSADGMLREMQMNQIEKIRLQKEENLHSVNPILVHDETWESGGFQVEEVVPPEIALETVKALPLKTYKLKDDKQRDLGVGKDERRTRYHVGVIGPGDGEIRVEPSSIFSYNIGAVSQLATSLDRLVTESSAFFRLQSSLEDKITTLTANTQVEIRSHNNTFKSPSQLASEVAALETEAALTRIARLSQTVLQGTRLNLVRSRFVSRVKSLVERDSMSARENRAERDSMSARETYAESAGAYLDQLLIHFDTVDKMKTAWNSTRRELVEMNEAGIIESHVAKEEIHAEAAVERENEAASLEQVKLVGKARVNEIVCSVENVFWHLARCLKHIMTPEGRQQFLFYVGTVAVLVFAVSTMKEVITLVCLCLLRFFTAPRLVREYGNLNARDRRSAKNALAVKEIILPTKIKERVDIIVKVASAASKRRFPLRSVLIHGEPGTGKSMIAKAIAHATGLPYALMSGADVFPLGSQGPAELRTLLTWASNKRHGGIIIIDEAETALGSRAKTRPDNEGSGTTFESDSAPSSSGFSRDCLNVLLSMTGSFGNIMLILTTNHPSEIDEAVLDRMDELVSLPLPTERERSALLSNQFFRLFCAMKDEGNHLSLVSRLLSKICRANTKARHEVQFDAEGCISNLATDSKTKGFSGRELEKIVQGILHKTYASDAGVLDRKLWEQETTKLIRTVVHKHLLK